MKADTRPTIYEA